MIRSWTLPSRPACVPSSIEIQFIQTCEENFFGGGYKLSSKLAFLTLPFLGGFSPGCRVGQFSTRSGVRNQAAPEVRVRKTAQKFSGAPAQVLHERVERVEGHLVHKCIYQYLYIFRVCSPHKQKCIEHNVLIN